MAKIVEFKKLNKNKRTTKCTNMDEYLISINKLNNEKEYVENDIKINNIINVLIKKYKVPNMIVDVLIDKINEKVAMEYEAKLIKNL